MSKNSPSTFMVGACGEKGLRMNQKLLKASTLLSGQLERRVYSWETVENGLDRIILTLEGAG